jgi:hypothetical protein
MVSEFDRARARENESKHREDASVAMLNQGTLSMLCRANALVRFLCGKWCCRGDRKNKTSPLMTRMALIGAVQFWFESVTSVFISVEILPL